jgi:hypothetical protein
MSLAKRFAFSSGLAACLLVFAVPQAPAAQEKCTLECSVTCSGYPPECEPECKLVCTFEL